MKTYFDSILHSKCTSPRGKSTKPDEIERLRIVFRDLIPDWYLQLLQDHPLAGCIFRYPGTGFTGEPCEWEAMWMTADQMIEEAIDATPGIVALRHSFVPVAGDPGGSGDQYFVRFAGDSDPPLSIILHDCVGDDILPRAVRTIAPSLWDYFSKSVLLA